MKTMRCVAIVTAAAVLAIGGEMVWPGRPAGASDSGVSTKAAAQCSATLPSGTVVGMATTSDGLGYWIASSTGQVAACGDATFFGNGPPDTVAVATAPSGNGYWLVTGAGTVQAFGSATKHGDLTGVRLSKPIVAMAADPATGGYWLLGGDGGVFSFDAPFYGSTGNIRLDKPAVGMAATPTGSGYYFVASDGGIFAFHAPFYGSTGNVRLNKPVVGMAIDRATGGYWMDASDGGIFAFHAPFYGSTGDVVLNQPCVGMSAMPDGSGYRFVASDGGIFDFHAPFEGSAVAPTPVAQTCSVSLSNYSPPDYTNVTATIRSNVPNSPVTLSKAYKTTTSYDYATSDPSGNASITFNDAGATVGYKVVVTVKIGSAQCSTSFTPR